MWMDIIVRMLDLVPYSVTSKHEMSMKWRHYHNPGIQSPNVTAMIHYKHNI